MAPGPPDIARASERRRYWPQIGENSRFFFAEPAVNGSFQFVGAKVQVTGIPDDNYGEERTASSLNPGV